MIYNGNYDYSTFDRIKDDLIEAFVRYYGENYRDTIEEKINKMKYYPYHPISYLVEYHNSFVKNYRDQILSKFFKKIGVRKNDTKANAVWEDGQNLGNINILNINYGGFDFNSSDFDDNTKQTVAKNRQTLAQAFNLENCSEEELYSTLMDYRKKFDESIDEVEQKNNCDVFQDMQTIRKNRVSEFKDFLNDIIETGYGVSKSDYELINSPTFVYSDISNLKSNLILFENSISNGGLVKFFTTNACNKLNSPKTSDIDKLKIIFNRLLYLNSLKSTKFKFLTKEQLETIKTEFNDCILNDIPFNKEMTDIIINEYNFQKDFRPAKNPKLHKTSPTELVSSWRRGEFIPSKLADEIEDIRDFHNKNILDNTKFIKIENIYQFDDEQYFTLRYYNNSDLFKYTADVVAGEEFYPNQDSYLGILIHEINHVLSSDNPYEVNTKTVKNRHGILLQSQEKSKNNKVGRLLTSSNTKELAEFINETQTQEILDIFHQVMDERNIQLPNDFVLDPNDYIFDCQYDYYKVIAYDFYNTFRDDLKESAINNQIDLFFKFDLPTNNLQNILDKPKSFINRIIDKDYYANGIMDVHKVEKLNELIQELETDVLPYTKNLSADDLIDLNWEDLELETQQKLFKLIMKKNKLMDEFTKDLFKKNCYIISHKKDYVTLDFNSEDDSDKSEDYKIQKFIEHLKNKLDSKNELCIDQLDNIQELV